jgi:hypothetical protein
MKDDDDDENEGSGRNGSQDTGGGSVIEAIDISGGFPLTVHGDWCRVTMAASVAGWCAENANAAWCLSPDYRGELEVTFALASDQNAFICWLANDWAAQ